MKTNNNRGGGKRMKINSVVKASVYLIFPTIIAFLFWSVPSEAVHKGAGDLTCGNCHTMHNSQGATNLGGSTTNGGSLVMLRAAVSGRQEIHNLCLRCHASNGDNADVAYTPPNNTAPKVYVHGADGKGIAASADDPFDFTKIGAGGDFSGTFIYSGGTITLNSSDNTPNYSIGKGHSLGATSVIPPGGINGIAFSCTSCHDPHGRNKSVTSTGNNGVNLYRMLRYSTVTEQGAAMSNPITGMDSWIGGINGLNFEGVNSGTNQHIWPVYNAADKQNVYAAGSNKADQSTGTAFSNFCVQCHVQWHESIAPDNKADNDWRRHPVDNPISESGSTISGAGVTITDFTWYSNSDSNSPLANGSSSGATKLPAMQSTSGSKTYYADSSDDRVFCLSCHYAHGGPNNDALRWNYTASVGSGSQVGNSVSVNVGCQQCHNR